MTLDDIKCDFCDKKHGEVRKHIAGPRAFICNECVELCVVILRDDIRPMLSEDIGA